jgi:methanogenic corrinoid protein MtbC1
MDQQLNHKFEKALLSLDRLEARKVLSQSQDRLNPSQFIEGVIGPVMEKIGQDWEQGSVALSQIYMSSRICEELVDEILPPKPPDLKNPPRMAIGVLEDYHLLGKRIVYSILRAAGFELLDYGRVTVDELIDRVREDKIEILLLSVLMLPSALQVRLVSDRLKSLNPDIKIVVGGAPFRFDLDLWQEVGADAMGSSASEALEIVSNFSGGR